MNEAQIEDQTKAQSRRTRPRLRGKAGYSLMEILIVLAIIGLLVALIGPRLTTLLGGGQVKAAKAQIVSLKQGLAALQLDIGRYPTEAEGLQLMVQSPGGGVANWNGPYLSGAIPKDPWGNPYQYTPPADSNGDPQIMSLGADGKPGGSGNDADIAG